MCFHNNELKDQHYTKMERIELEFGNNELQHQLCIEFLKSIALQIYQNDRLIQQKR